ncbi:hypothetical protein SNOG_01906 [Parastagonospora nodorum SN15]|uniref:Uncharacterized protein n=1 Tax=Phaeosphaeria nodorum (strain SN15 / ATCC MYA-4574 / FGSC 10173) TaxID=321614 RepID=Q0V258_PHANO|nr:hypothetical protein SNOG_01906 [Parastagonospora nodorum SN15]EAT90118.1 hypothetical protein SNOG_01906 [Parastagonospora nodorum SN15]
MTNYLRNEMANVLLKKSIQRVSFLSQSVIDSEHFYDPIDLLADAVRIYASTPFNGAHALTVQITALPFCIPSYRDQIFYCVDASYAKCCHEIEKEDFVLFLHLITEDGFQNLTEQHPVRNQDDGSIDQYAICFQDETKSKLSLHQDFISSATSPPCPCSTSTQIQNEYAAVTMSYSGGTPKVQLKNENAILELADEFLRNLSSTSVASAATDSTVNGSVKTFLFHTINEKMREAGFSGSSRNLKALRDETIFINQLVASVESMHGIGIASLVLYHIFESSNYHRIRLMNRYAETKKRLAIWQICGNLNLDVQLKTELPELRIQTLILEYMPDLW